MPRKGNKMDRTHFDKLLEAVALVDELMIGEYLGVPYEGWLKIQAHEILSDIIIDFACRIHGYDEGAVAAAILDAMADLQDQRVQQRVYDEYRPLFTYTAPGPKYDPADGEG